MLMDFVLQLVQAFRAKIPSWRFENVENFKAPKLAGGDKSDCFSHTNVL